jgi:aspartyl/asparaginyl beta-hydroxylase (cupin superfamily)
MKTIMKYFYDVEKFAFTDILIEAYPKIKHEWDRTPKWLKRLMSKKANRYTTDGKENTTLRATQGNWSVLPIMTRHKTSWWVKYIFPTTYSLIDHINIFENLLFSVFAPNTEITEHVGWTDKIARVHLAIHTNEDASLEVLDEKTTLKDGEVLCFNDGVLHHAYNRSNKERVVLLFDYRIEQLGINLNKEKK